MSNQYPEHEKLQKIQDQSQMIGDFLSWLQEEKGLSLCSYQGEKHKIDLWCPTDANTSKLLADYFEIDEKKLEEEKQKMLQELRG